MKNIATLQAAAAEGMRMKTDREVIEGALALIEADAGWTQGTYCRDAEGAFDDRRLWPLHPADDEPGTPADGIL